MPEFQNSSVTQGNTTNTTIPHTQVQQPVNNQSDYSTYELKMVWSFRKNLFWLYAIALILSITAAVFVVITRGNVIPSAVPISLVASMKSMIKWAFPPQTS